MTILANVHINFRSPLNGWIHCSIWVLLLRKPFDCFVFPFTPETWNPRTPSLAIPDFFCFSEETEETSVIGPLSPWVSQTLRGVQEGSGGQAQEHVPLAFFFSEMANRLGEVD